MARQYCFICNQMVAGTDRQAHLQSQHPESANRLQVVFRPADHPDELPAFCDDSRHHYEDEEHAHHQDIDLYFNGLWVPLHEETQYCEEDDESVHLYQLFLFGSQLCHLSYALSKSTGLVTNVDVSRIVRAQPGDCSDYQEFGYKLLIQQHCFGGGMVEHYSQGFGEWDGPVNATG